MHRWTDLSQIPTDLGSTVVTLGNFDGVHRGHQAVLQRLAAEAVARSTLSVAVTFDPHPIAVLYPDRAPGAITSLDERLARIEAAGVDGVLVLEFTREFAQQTPEEFVRSVFVDALRARAVVVGRDTRFGVRNSGTVDTLVALGERLGFEVVVLDDVGAGHRWSSTQLRINLAEGDVAAASEILGRPHAVTGTVVHGDHRGRLLGYPTANLSQDSQGYIPSDGVYAGWLVRPGLPLDAADRTLPAAISVGTNPTFNGTQRRVEAYVLDRTDLELYDEYVAISFIVRLRPTLKFDSVDALIVQMRQDCADCREILGTPDPID
ncbi:MAG TPA: bifunctional riboflavin kinase/FAD synthetase [Candidatus Lustribacter sp.]|nr:bifunctional riboflavin kinase/FAD synthetase [Candidatus Lustribacter sp.]